MLIGYYSIFNNTDYNFFQSAEFVMENRMDNNEIYRIRPAGRHILTIGSDLIQDQYAAIVELVKNAYDADSPDVEIEFRVSNDTKNLTITIADRGHGMSRDTVINKWLVPSTDDKLRRKISPKGRTMQGRKGIGRYAASILGESLFLKTITKDGEKTEVMVAWDDFENAEYLSDVEVLVDTKKTNEPSGTTLIITGGKKHLLEWMGEKKRVTELDESQITRLKFELRKLIPPINSELFPEVLEEEFGIFLHFYNFFHNQKGRISEQIKPYPIIDLYDYRISGTINANGKGKLNYRNQRARNTIDEDILIDVNNPTNCGKLTFDIRVYDREADAIEHLIKRGLKDERGDYVGKLQARQLLNEYNGIGVYRNGFRIRPMGDPDYDWLELNRKRVQNPSQKIGSNQVIGFVLIQSEEMSGLIEKSARDGLRQNQAYKHLVDIANNVIDKLETRRYEYRKKSGLSRITIKIERELEKLFAFEDLKHGIRSKLTKAGVSEETSNEIIKIIAKKEAENNQLADNIRQTVAIYQGQATLGKILNVVLHEGRRPLNFFKNQVSNLDYQANELKSDYSEKRLAKLLSTVNEFGTNAEVLVDLFGRLDPLAAGKRGKKKELKLEKVLNGAFQVLGNELIKNEIQYSVTCSSDALYSGWEQDFYAIMTNLIDNSIYWINNKQPKKKEIHLVVNFDKTLQYIDYRDTGPGIEEHLIETEVIFEPEFSTKPNGTGLGLAIAGEAALRNGLELKAFASNIGAYFRLQPKED
jgi:signal transduction histidine kinase